MTEAELKAKLDELLHLPAETEWVEFKEAKSNFDSDDLGKYFVALCNRVGQEEKLQFAGESFVCGPDGTVIARAKLGTDEILYADIDFKQNAASNARRLFMRDRRPELYAEWLAR